MLLKHAIPTFLVVAALSSPIQAGPSTDSFVSIPIEKATPPSHSFERTFTLLPSALLHQQHANRGIRRLALMMGQDRPSDDEFLAEMSSRLSNLPESSDFLRILRGSKSNPHVASFHSRKTRRRFRRPIARDTTESDPITLPNAAEQFNDVKLDIQSEDYGYVGKIEIGTPPRNFSLLMDSGSADFWVGGDDCQGLDGQSCGNHTFLGANSSSTFNDLNETWSINYNSGKVSGTMVQDNISFAGLRMEAFKFGVAHIESPEFIGDDIIFDGIAGLAKSIISSQRTITMVEAFRKAGVINNSIVSFKIPRLLDDKNDGEMAIGGMNEARYDATKVVVVKNLSKFGFWETPIDQVSINGTPMNWSRTGVLDTGTALLIAPREDVEAIHAQITNATEVDGAWTVPCKYNVTISLTIGELDFSIDPRDLAFMPVDSNEPEGDCWSGIGVGTVGPFNLPTTWLLGDVFLKNVYHSMNADEGKDEITFAGLK